ncbi:GNAT family N-acetyltransferase [Derxia lacustris]|uniref:GNAT family N-acetyltransferase n=1 Tax=Derxia lacustris TaxID=764842 RepID=UPI000A1721D9|nr:GNAT family N-acetyltransferase [Derxia lacustris]
MRLRAAGPADADAIADLHTASWRDAYRAALRADWLADHAAADRRALWRARLGESPAARRVLLAHEASGALAGFVCVQPGADAHWGALLDNLHVAERCRRQGIGRALMEAAARVCQAETPGAGLFLWVLRDNLRAQAFYRALGASDAGSDLWDAPDGSRVPICRFAWTALPEPHR